MSEHDLYSQVPANVPRPRADPQAGLRGASLPGIIARIEEAVEVETRSIRTDVTFDLQASNDRKSRYLYELNKAVRDIRPDVLQANRDGIIRLRGKLAENQAAIAAHLKAVTEVAGLIQDAIEQSEADGTYGSDAFTRMRSA
ncbi:hypothetical protein [Aquibium sp. ELW1220]|jgi:hypothetical protein|uniref:hypothetical protein n=1 Tax=Aquibium sp. ELW1220 TaxID=2976766 RepID=UPI0025AF3AAF|nr:hypothetical protein [Aquibium sp. ELW1220]MDN2580744.1 hypothetical protein [Aquibium sp. ELW1220]